MSVRLTTTVTFLAPEHAEAMQALVSDPILSATTRLPNPYPAGGARDFIEKCRAEHEQGKSYVLAILDQGIFVGACGLHLTEARNDAELGYWVGRPFWGRGYATAGVRQAAELAFATLRLPRMHAHALEHNLPSRRVLEKNGFHFIGYGHHTEARWDPAERVALYELTPAIWREHTRLLGREGREGR